ncbi:MAG: hypothetical protein LBM99_04620, partial [Bacillales bacterium]|nr:hypothetical protein [Bacillales bacterium]
MKKHLFLIVLLLIGCGKKTSSSSFDSSSFLESTSSSSFDVNALLDDPDADGQYGNGVNENRFPDDDLYETVQERKRILNVGETYLETFENDYLETKLYPDYVDAQATVQILETGNCHIAGKSVCLTTPGNYYGTRFSGMKFARNGSYHIEFDYKIVVASNDFFFQFRSMAGGIATDIYKVIQGSAGSSGHLTFEVTFDDYSDYALSIFPRNNAGKLAIDNISITRLNSVPRVLGGSVVGTLSVGHTLTYSYNYYDSEGDVEALSEITWFTALNKNGLNKTVISEAGTSLLVTSDMVGKYVGFSVVPISVGTSQTKGKSYLFYSDTRIDSLGIEIPSNIYLDYGETFEEDFEEDLNVVGNIYAEENEAGATTYLIDDSNVLSGSKSLYFESKGSYSGIVFSGIKFANLGLYKLEYDFKFLEKSGNYYVQFRTNAGYSYDKFTDISMTTYTLGTQYHYSNTFALDNFNDYYLMMFPSTNPTKIIIDNIKITRLEGDNVIINDVELDIGQYLLEDF